MLRYCPLSKEGAIVAEIWHLKAEAAYLPVNSIVVVKALMQGWTCLFYRLYKSDLQLRRHDPRPP